MREFKIWPWSVCCVLIALIALVLLGSSYFKIEDKHEGFDYADSITTEPTAPMVEHVYLILVDGLRADTFDKMPFTKSLADQGSFGIFTVPAPTFSRPAYTRIITGACSSINGISSNNQEKKLFAPTLFDLAEGEGLKAGLSAYRWYYDLLYGPPYRTGEEDENRLIRDRAPLKYGYFYDDFGGDYDDEEIFARGIEALAEDNPNFLLVHSMDVDEMGHRHGGISPEYLDAALLNDRCIEEFVSQIPAPEESVIIITGDHGHIDSGGHGGLEREAVEIKVAFYGKGVAPGELPDGYTQLDLAPTIAALLGLPFTSYMEGRIVAEAFDWPAETMAQKAALLGETQRPLLRELGERFNAEPTDNDDGRALERLARTVNRRWIALRGALALVFLLAAFLCVRRLLRKRLYAGEDVAERKGHLYISLAATVLSLAVYSATLYLYGFGYSYSYINQMSDLGRVPLAGLTAFAVFLAVLLLGRVNLRGFVAAGTCLLGATVLIATAAGILQGGVKFLLPQVTFYMIYMLTLAQLVVYGLLCAITGVIMAPAERRRRKTAVGG